MSGSFSILIVDDSPDDREHYLRSLKKVEGVTYRCLEAEQGRKGIEIADAQRVDCVLLDYSLPGMNGLEVLKTMRMRHAYLPVILLTGQGNESVAVEAIKQGAYDYLAKSSLTPERLHQAITSAINQGMLKRHIAEKDFQIAEKTHALELSEERYQLAVLGMSVGLWDWNVETDELYWSQQFKDILGIEDKDFCGHYRDFFDRLHPDYKAATMDALTRHFEQHVPFNVEYQMRHNNGEYVWIHACGQAKWDASGKPVRMVGSVNNISARKKLEIERKTFIEKLTESNSELERFAYICSHDLQEPLRMISNFSERLEKHLEDVLDDKGRHYLKYVTDGAVQARQLISDVLNYARVDHETERLSNIDSEKILSGVLRDLNSSIEEKGAKITHDALPEVYMQSVHLRQLLQNMLSNALKFCSKEPHIHVGVERDGAMWRFCVRDNGIGIAPENMQKIFSIFQRLHSRERYPGTGIGLALCKKLVQKYNGRIWVESKPDIGSSFYFTLPPAEECQSEAA